ncbi:MAG: SDR family oxidoreductase [Anaerolineae bacterium]|nr:SDR family oxidoreductase [Anaerolineae bacterium]
MTRPLSGKIALVAGATRGAGRGIAVELGAAGATVYCVGRSVRGALASGAHRTETIDETAERVTAAGGHGIALRADFTQEAQVRAAFEQVQAAHGRLDVLVNDIWGGEAFMRFGTPFWEYDYGFLPTMLERALMTHIWSARYGVPLMLPQRSGLVVEVTDGGTPDVAVGSFAYRGMLWYDMIKNAVIRMAFGMGEELKPHGITALAITPGFLRSEEMLDLFGVTEANWRDATAQEPHFIASETPHFVGRAVAALAADPAVFAKTSSWGLSDEYGFADLDGNRPHWGRHFAQHVLGGEE